MLRTALLPDRGQPRGQGAPPPAPQGRKDVYIASREGIRKRHLKQAPSKDPRHPSGRGGRLREREKGGTRAWRWKSTGGTVSCGRVRAGQSEDQQEMRLHCRGFKLETLGSH